MYGCGVEHSAGTSEVNSHRRSSLIENCCAKVCDDRADLVNIADVLFKSVSYRRFLVATLEKTSALVHGICNSLLQQQAIAYHNKNNTVCAVHENTGMCVLPNRRVFSCGRKSLPVSFDTDQAANR